MSFRLTIALLFGVALVTFGLVLHSFDNYAGKVALASAVLGALAALLFPRSLFEGKRAPAPLIHRSSTGFEVRGEGAAVSASALLEATMESIREGMLVVDGRAHVLASNNAARALFGEVAAATSGERRLSELTRDPSIHAAFAAALEGGERAEVKVEVGAGERRVFDLHVAPLKVRAGAAAAAESRRAVGVFFDITRLERLERVRQEFLSNVSHELRTPLTAILTFVETLEGGAIDDPEHNRRFLSVIRRNSERMHNLINDILELSAIEAGTVEVEPAPVRLSPLVNDCLTALASRAEERRITLRNEVPAGVTVRAEARRLEQMLTNLLDNAIKFSAEGGEVRVSHERAAGRDRVHVADAGEGIAAEHVERIFERFYRVDRARSRALGGTGLGLAIVKHLARAHGGEASVRSAPGEGSVFTVELPAETQG
jgi:two-component system, OmpR family, phosphate regulon sensor histidine kinase PhoR